MSGEFFILAFISTILLTYIYIKIKDKKYYDKITQGTKYHQTKQLNKTTVFREVKPEFIYAEFFNSLNKFRNNTINATLERFKKTKFNDFKNIIESLKENYFINKAYLFEFNNILESNTETPILEKGLNKKTYLRKEKELLNSLLIKPSLACKFHIYYYYESPKGRSYHDSEHINFTVESNSASLNSFFDLLADYNLKSEAKNTINENPELNEANYLPTNTQSTGLRFENNSKNNIKSKRGDEFVVYVIFKVNILRKISMSIKIMNQTIKEEIKDHKFRDLADENMLNKYLYLEKFLNDYDYLETGEQFLDHSINISNFYKEDSRFIIDITNITEKTPDELFRQIKIEFGIDFNCIVYIKSFRIGKIYDVDGYLEMNQNSSLKSFFQFIDGEISNINSNISLDKRLEKLKEFILLNSNSFTVFEFVESTKIIFNISLFNRKNEHYSIKNEILILNNENKIKKSLLFYQSIDLGPLNAYEHIYDELLILSNNILIKREKLLLKLAILRENYPDKGRLFINFSQEIINSEVWFSYFNKKPDLPPMNINQLDEGNHKINKKINEVMRDYQRYAFQWLSKLVTNGISGILADDMGLGKSLEMISIMEADKTKLPNLIICPVSVTHNWMNEFLKWSPNENVLIININNKNELNKQSYARKVTFIISYDFLVHNFDQFAKIDFNFVILDEAQYIKNKETKRAKTVKKLYCKIRFALTGTPIENKEEDLWSIFEFLSPKLFEAYKINHLSSENKRLYIKPFILRRKKADVLKELPDKNEILTTLNMTNKQKESYDYYESMWVDYKDNPVKLLALLIRLRQICVTPKLINDEIKSDSCKLIHLSELIENILESNESMLIYSSFVKSFSHVEEILKKKKINYLSLNGSIKGDKRATLIEEFQKNNKVKVFLISLKAGGIGLNLTKANNVIFLDPWWNKSVENQAADRVHRIGQEKKVSIYKLICSETIEEKVLQIQKEKIEVMNYFIDSDNDKPLGKLSLDLMQKLFTMTVQKDK